MTYAFRLQNKAFQQVCWRLMNKMDLLFRIKTNGYWRWFSMKSTANIYADTGGSHRNVEDRHTSNCFSKHTILSYGHLNTTALKEQIRTVEILICLKSLVSNHIIMEGLEITQRKLASHIISSIFGWGSR